MKKINFDPSKITTVIWDKDGVIVDSCYFHYEACLKLVKKSGKEIFTFQEFKDHHRENFYDNGKNIFSGLIWDDYDDLIRDKYPLLPISNKTVFTILSLHHSGYSQSIISSCHEGFIRESLRNNKLEQYFEIIWGKQTNKSKINKFQDFLSLYNLELDQCVYITDTLRDINEAAECGIASIAVDYGYHTAETLCSGHIQPVTVIDRPGTILYELGLTKV